VVVILDPGAFRGRWIVTIRSTRRKPLSQSAQLAGAVGIGILLLGTGRLTEDSLARGKQLRIVIASAHPDDPETGCGGTVARYTDLGHKVIVLYLTRGERGISGKTYEEAGIIRTDEAL
jgi:LmbE family N-acetylglucosaminyl deacetylase